MILNLNSRLFHLFNLGTIFSLKKTTTKKQGYYKIFKYGILNYMLLLNLWKVIYVLIDKNHFNGTGFQISGKKSW